MKGAAHSLPEAIHQGSYTKSEVSYLPKYLVHYNLRKASGKWGKIAIFVEGSSGTISSHCSRCVLYFLLHNRIPGTEVSFTQLYFFSITELFDENIETVILKTCGMVIRLWDSFVNIPLRTGLKALWYVTTCHHVKEGVSGSINICPWSYWVKLLGNLHTYSVRDVSSQRENLIQHGILHHCSYIT